jgi:hypothetical protein
MPIVLREDFCPHNILSGAFSDCIVVDRRGDFEDYTITCEKTAEYAVGVVRHGSYGIWGRQAFLLPMNQRANE